MLRSGRFRHRLLEPSFLQNNADDIFICLQDFIRLWKDQQIQDYEMAAIYIFVFSFFRRPLDFLGGPHNEFHLASKEGGISSLKVISILQERLPNHLNKRKILDRLRVEKNFVEHFCNFSWRSIPLSVPHSLRAWQCQLYPLDLCLNIPSPEDVLNMQAQGRRCVSMLIKKEEIQDFVEEGRDVLGFIVHDLIHAHHFFRDTSRAQAQVEFCQKLKSIYALSAIQERLNQDPHFRTEFFYLMADMNSVPLHLLKTLKAVLLGHFKRKNSNNFSKPLSPHQESEFLALYALVLKAWTLTPEATQAALRLNTSDFCPKIDAVLLSNSLNKLS